MSVLPLSGCKDLFSKPVLQVVHAHLHHCPLRQEKSFFSIYYLAFPFPSSFYFFCSVAMCLICSASAPLLIWIPLSSAPESLCVRLWSTRGAQTHENATAAELPQLALRDDPFVDEATLPGEQLCSQPIVIQAVRNLTDATNDQ